jgi:putative addiction module component (TIGR02574 family)
MGAANGFGIAGRGREIMALNIDELRALPPAEKLRLVELLWDDLGASDVPIPLPDSVDREAARRRDEMPKDSNLGMSHEETWERIKRRNG